jgi:hypothetical protein
MPENRWKEILRGIHNFALLLVLLTSISLVYCLGFLLKTGSSSPTPNQTQPLNLYGTVYVTPIEQLWFNGLRSFSVIGFLVVVVGGLFLQNVAGIKLYGPVSYLPVSREAESHWSRTARKMLGYAFMLVLLAGAFSFCYFYLLMLRGSPTPTPSETEPLSIHGSIVYVTLFEKRTLNWLWMFFFAGMPALGMAALFFHFVLRIKLFSKATPK